MKKKVIASILAAAMVSESALVAGAATLSMDAAQPLRLLEPSEILLAAAADEGEEEGGEEDSSRSRRRRSEASEEEDTSSTRERRRSEVSEDSDDDRGSRRRSRRSRSRRSSGPRRHKVLPGLVIPGAVLMGLGVFLMYDGFRSNPQPDGYTTLSYSYGSAGGGYYNLYNTGTYYNTGKGGVYPYFSFTVRDPSNIYITSYNYSPSSSVDEGSSAYWYYYRYSQYCYGYVPTKMSVSTTETWDGGWAMNNVWEGTAGVVSLVVGTALLIVGLTHTEAAMDDAGVKLQLQRTSNDQLALAASKSF